MRVIPVSELLKRTDYVEGVLTLHNQMPVRVRYSGRASAHNSLLFNSLSTPLLYNVTIVEFQTGAAEFRIDDKEDAYSAAMNYAAPIYATPARKDHTQHEVVESAAMNKSFKYCRTCKEEVYE